MIDSLIGRTDIKLKKKKPKQEEDIVKGKLSFQIMYPAKQATS